MSLITLFYIMYVLGAVNFAAIIIILDGWDPDEVSMWVIILLWPIYGLIASVLILSAIISKYRKKVKKMSKELDRYKKALVREINAKDIANTAFRELFKVGGFVDFRKKINGPIYTGKIVSVFCWLRRGRRVRIISLKTGREYWVEGYWIVLPEGGE